MQRNPGILLSSLRRSLKRTRHQLWRELQALGSPVHPAGRLAAAFALGTLISFVPVPFLDSLLLALVLAKYKQVNRAAIFMSRLIWNDLLVFPLFAPGYRLGSELVQPLVNPAPSVPGIFMSILSFAVGSTILAVSATICGFCVFLLVVNLLRLINRKGLAAIDKPV